jgi:hypothetical protein
MRPVGGEVGRRQVAQPGPPPGVRDGEGLAGGDAVDHELQQFRLARHVGVERRRADAERLRERAHRQSGRPGSVGLGDRGVDDPGQLEPLPRPAPRDGRSVPEQRHRARGVAASRVLHPTSYPQYSEHCTVLLCRPRR